MLLACHILATMRRVRLSLVGRSFCKRFVGLRKSILVGLWEPLNVSLDNKRITDSFSGISYTENEREGSLLDRLSAIAMKNEGRISAMFC